MTPVGRVKGDALTRSFSDADAANGRRLKPVAQYSHLTDFAAEDKVERLGLVLSRRNQHEGLPRPSSRYSALDGFGKPSYKAFRHLAEVLRRLEDVTIRCLTVLAAAVLSLRINWPEASFNRSAQRAARWGNRCIAQE